MCSVSRVQLMLVADYWDSAAAYLDPTIGLGNCSVAQALAVPAVVQEVGAGLCLWLWLCSARTHSDMLCVAVLHPVGCCGWGVQGACREESTEECTR